MPCDTARSNMTSTLKPLPVCPAAHNAPASALPFDGLGFGVDGNATPLALAIFNASLTTNGKTVTKVATLSAPNFFVSEATSAWVLSPANTLTNVTVWKFDGPPPAM